jgi:hypothetical protein
VHPVADATGTPYQRLDDLRTALRARGVAAGLRPVPGTWIAAARQMLVCQAR